jgi:hypothetical protein
MGVPYPLCHRDLSLEGEVMLAKGIRDQGSVGRKGTGPEALVG